MEISSLEAIITYLLNNNIKNLLLAFVVILLLSFFKRLTIRYADDIYQVIRIKKMVPINNYAFITRQYQYHQRNIINVKGSITYYKANAISLMNKNKFPVIMIIHGDEDYQKREYQTLTKLYDHTNYSQHHLPKIIDRFKSKQNTVIVYQWCENALSLKTIVKRFDHGIEFRHVLWILRRTLVILGYAHKKGILHNHINPDSILINPTDHNVILTQWGYSGCIDINNTMDANYLAPEVKDRSVTIESDMYALGKTMIYALGGDITTNHIPAKVDQRFANVLLFLVKKNVKHRADDAWKLYHELENIRDNIFDKPHHFVEFIVPN